ncbi:DUF255 domain-containing protein [Halomarina ordinaria]|uniref:DUF255 domain-containing protein n=1 Tax=Halomarina ordinaria TaxID=3033939 RepID=A0ABD5UDM2_9EURY|nr:DUF255 domain-containing protein [Halomarina sp. PSRA2]
MDDETLVEWHEWGPAPFEEARAADRPVLLSLTAPWCHWCARMDEEAYSNPSVAANIHDDFVPVRVDIDRHPRVRERYQMGGFPSTVVLTPSGDIVSGATYMTTENLRTVLERVREVWDERGEDAGRVPRALRDPEPPRGHLDGEVEGHMLEQVRSAFDEEYGGWGVDAKFPLPRTVEFALKRDRDRALRTLEAVHTHLYDTYGGGFYRYATGRDWSDPHREKLLDENAAVARAFANAYLYTGETTYRDAALGTRDYLTTTLWSGDAFAGSQAGGDYYTLEASEREAADPPHVDGTVFADRNGLAVDALLRLHAYTDDEAAGRYARRALDHVRETLVDDGAVAHYARSEGERGLLADQARVLGALVTAGQVLDPDYFEAARSVADWTVDRRLDDGTFTDGPQTGPALLSRPLRPLETTVELADALVDLSLATGEERYRTVAEDALSAFAGARHRMGVEVAGYATAASRVVRDPLVVRVADAPGSDLHRAAWRVADHEKVVVPGADGEPGTARVVVDGEAADPVETPAELDRRVRQSS